MMQKCEEGTKIERPENVVRRETVALGRGTLSFFSKPNLPKDGGVLTLG